MSWAATPSRRLTLVAHETGCADCTWNEVSSRGNVVYLEKSDVPRLSLLKAISEPTLDIERVILDDGGSAETFLELLAALPGEFTGDVLRVDQHGRGFLSATGRGGDRVLYSLEPYDVRFYLLAHELLTGQSSELEMTA